MTGNSIYISTTNVHTCVIPVWIPMEREKLSPPGILMVAAAAMRSWAKARAWRWWSGALFKPAGGRAIGGVSGQLNGCT